MSDNASSQFYADNESEGLDAASVDLSIAYEIKSKAVAEEEWDEQKIVFFCRDCGKLVASKRHPKKVQFSCVECHGSRVLFGTQKSLSNFFHLNDEGVQKK